MPVSYTHLDVYKRQPLAGPAIEAVRSGEIKFVPERFDKNYFFWMENTRDWCISRQLWWGHRIPASVSYTHLDVSKRQTQDLLRRHGGRGAGGPFGRQAVAAGRDRAADAGGLYSRPRHGAGGRFIGTRLRGD